MTLETTSVETPLRIVVLSGGIGQPSSTRLLGDRLADAVRTQLGAQGRRATVEVIELREHATDVARFLTSAIESDQLREAKQQVIDADALVVVTPVFNAGVAGLVKSFLDLFTADDLGGMPVLLGATGGTARHSMVIDHGLRPVTSHLRMWAVPTGVFVATEEWGATGGPNERIARAAGELVDLLVRTPRRQVVDPYEDVTPFAQMLGG